MLANHIRDIRKAKGIDPTELAFRIGCSTNTLGRYERGESTISLATARRLSAVLGASIDELFPAEELEAA